MNKEIEMLYKTLEAKDKIINKQVLMISELKDRIDKAIEYINYSKEISNPINYIKFEQKLLQILGEKE